jgi:homoserine O-acetyltransferase/O-succinyltransferase
MHKISQHHFVTKQAFKLENGSILPELDLAYHSFGRLNFSKTNVVWVFHALTANSNPMEWWPGVIGNNAFINPTNHFIICVNMPSSCYGSISPLTIDPTTEKPYYTNFPLFSIKDMVHAYQLLKTALGIQQIWLGIGGSMGGQQLLEWAIEEPNLFENIVPIATNAEHSQWGIAFNESQRWAIEQDTTWKTSTELSGHAGMLLARSIAMLSYRNYAMYGLIKQTENKNASSYQRYQGEKLGQRFNAYSYWYLSKSMDSHDVGRGRKNTHTALATIQANTLVIGIESDLLFPKEEQEFLSKNIPRADLKILHSNFGHDGFLLEHEAINELLVDFLQEHNIKIDIHPISHQAM